MSGMDLADFLLARIAEDEAEWGNPAFAPVAGQGLSRLVLKMRAECAAKRRIVKELATSRKALAALPGGSGRLAVQYGLEASLRLLALPYADHPDYREEWRPGA